MVSENASRKMDELGRVSIPKNIRDRYGWKAGDMLELFTDTWEGKRFVCLTADKEDKWKLAAEMLVELGIELPKEIEERVGR